MAPVPLAAELEAALVRELGHTWAEINGNHFGRRLRRPVLEMTDGVGRLGQWKGTSRTLSLSRQLLTEQPWAIVREVLKHEMAHQFVDEILGVRDETAHGPTFERVCHELGIDATASGLPKGGEPRDEGDQAVLRRIAKLLALAESPNRHEAELAMRQARRLMLEHNIDAAATAGRKGYSFRQVGVPRGRIDAHEHLLASLLGDHFFVEVIWVPSFDVARARQGRVLEICGTPANIEVASYVHEFLLRTGERLWQSHRRTHGLPGNRERRRFLIGVVTGFAEKLRAGAQESQREGLVWVGDPALGAYLDQRYPRRRSGGSIGFRTSGAFEHGRSAGRDIVLAKPVHGTEARGRLLGPTK